MASRELSILVTAKNMASKALGQVRGDVNKLDRAGRQAGSNLGRNVALGGAAVAAGIATQVKAGVDSLVELERVENLTAAALKSTGNLAQQSVEGIRARSEAMENLTGIDDKAIQNAQNLLLTYRNVGEDAFEPTLEAALNLNAALGGNDESLQGVLMSVARAINDPARGLTLLERKGVSFTKAQKAQIAEMLEANDIMGAQAIMLEELETQFGDAAEQANKGPLGAQRAWTDAIEDIQKALATGFLPLIEKASGKIQEMVSNPAFMAGVQEFGEAIAGALEAGIDFASSVPWDAVGAALQTAGTGARMAMDAFLSAPAWLQTAILTGWGLNKLTGGALGSLVGMIGQGIIKGVMNMNAGVVNINAATVNGGGGGVPGVGGKGGGFLGGLGKGLLTGGVIGGAAVATGAAVVTVGNFMDMRSEATGHLEGILDDMPRRTAADINTSISKIEAQISQERPFLEGILFNTNVKPVLEAELGELQRQQAQAAVEISRGTTGIQQKLDTETARAAGSDAAMLNSAITAQGQLFHQTRLAEGAASSDAAMLGTASRQASSLSTIQGIEGGNAGRLQAIANKSWSTSVNVSVTPVNYISVNNWTRVEQSASISYSSLGGGI